MTAAAKCQHECEEHHACGCDGTVPHTLHVCRNPQCRCHQAAYRMELVVDRNGEPFYVPQGARLVRKPVTV